MTTPRLIMICTAAVFLALLAVDYMVWSAQIPNRPWWAYWNDVWADDRLDAIL